MKEPANSDGCAVRTQCLCGQSGSGKIDPRLVLNFHDDLPEGTDFVVLVDVHLANPDRLLGGGFLCQLRHLLEDDAEATGLLCHEYLLLDVLLSLGFYLLPQVTEINVTLAGRTDKHVVGWKGHTTRLQWDSWLEIRLELRHCVTVWTFKVYEYDVKIGRMRTLT